MQDGERGQAAVQEVQRGGRGQVAPFSRGPVLAPERLRGIRDEPEAEDENPVVVSLQQRRGFKPLAVITYPPSLTRLF